MQMLIIQLCSPTAGPKPPNHRKIPILHLTIILILMLAIVCHTHHIRTTLQRTPIMPLSTTCQIIPVIPHH